MAQSVCVCGGGGFTALESRGESTSLPLIIAFIQAVTGGPTPSYLNTEWTHNGVILHGELVACDAHQYIYMYMHR